MPAVNSAHHESMRYAVTWLALLLKPFIAPFILFALFLPARWGAVAAVKWMPDGRLKRLLLKRV